MSQIIRKCDITNYVYENKPFHCRWNNICLKGLTLHITYKICHTHYEEQDAEASFFMV